MTNGVGIMLDTGLIFESDSRAHARVDNFAHFCKKTVFERARDRVIVLLSSSNLAGTQAVISVLRQRNAKNRGSYGYSELYITAKNCRL
jgi:putative proteasome-type protease